ncbi:MAG: alpha/beta hydrolase [Pseudomonadota bacterium]
MSQPENRREGGIIVWRIDDWDDAYANAPNIPDGTSWPGRWEAPSAGFREAAVSAGTAELDVAYGDRPRNRLDLFRPNGTPKGLVVFIHGGFWMRFDKSYWSHLAAGAIARGWAVALPSYTLAPEIQVREITREMGAAISSSAERVSGPIVLTGHSAGGHLATRMVCSNTPLPEAVRSRVAHTLSISGVHDLRPLLRTKLNDGLHLDHDEARAESPVLLEPGPNVSLTCWVGAAERSEFVRLNALLANIWKGCGAATTAVEEPDRHHFDVIDGLGEPDSPIVHALLGPVDE